MLRRIIDALAKLELAGMWLATHSRAARTPLVALTQEPEWRVRVRAIELGEAPSIVADDDLVASDLIASTARSFLARGGLRRSEERGQS